MDKHELADQLDRLFQEWSRRGASAIVAQKAPEGSVRPIEGLIAETTTHCRESGRLTWATIDWLTRHIAELDVDRVLSAAQRAGDMSVLGVLCDAANAANPNSKFGRIIAACKPAETEEPFFHRVARSPLALKLTRANALDLFRRWNYLCSELRYL